MKTEDAPLSEKLTLKPEEEKMTDIKEYKLFLDNQEIKTQIGRLDNSSKILFILEETNELNNYYYKSEYSLEDLRNINKSFRSFDSIKEAFIEIEGIIQNKNVCLQKENNDMIIHLSIANFTKKEDSPLKIRKENKSKEQIYELLFQKINQLNDIIIKDRTNFEKRISSLEQRLKEEKQKNEILQKTVDELKQNVDELNNYKLIDSKIINKKRI